MSNLESDQTNYERSELLTVRPLVVLPYTARIDPRGAIRLSSHSSLAVDAAFHIFEEGLASKIIIPGENTFGLRFISTSELMKRTLLKKGVPERLILSGNNLNDTETQLRWVREQKVKIPRVLVLRFHQDRVEDLMRQIGLQGFAVQVEPVILRHHPRATQERLEKLVRTKVRMYGSSAVDFAEAVGKTGTRLGRPGKAGVQLIRVLTRSTGPTVTDYHSVEPAWKHFNKAVTELAQKGVTIHNPEID